MSASIPFDLIQVIARYEVDLEAAKTEHKRAEARVETARQQVERAWNIVAHLGTEIERHTVALNALTQNIRPEVLERWWAEAREAARK